MKTAEQLLGVDIPVWCISLDGSPRWDRAEAAIRASGFASIKRWGAVRGSALSEDDKDRLLTPRARADLKQFRNAHEDLGTEGAVGCYLSHVGIWQWIVDNNVPMAVVFEDDVKFGPEFYSQFRHAWKDLLKTSGGQFDALFFGYLRKRGRFQSASPLLDRCRGRFFGTQAYVITHDGAQKLLSRAFPIDAQVDAYIGDMAHNDRTNDLRIYFPKTPIVKQSRGMGTTIQTHKGLKAWVPNNLTPYLAIVMVAVVAYVLKRILCSPKRTK